MSGLSGESMGRPLVSLVVPFYNESASVETFHAALASSIGAIDSVDFEIVCVDDGSRDDTLARLLVVVSRDSRFRVIELSRNFGKEAALTAGIEAARGDAVIPMDADLQDPPDLIAQMIRAWQQGTDVVLAHRLDRASDSFAKRKTAEFFYRFHNRVSPVKVPENVGDFRLMDRKVVDALGRLPETQRFMKGLFAWVGFRAVSIDYTRSARAAGDSKFSGWKLWNLALEGITSFSTAPLKVWTYIGGVGALLSFGYALFIIGRTVILGRDVPGYASLLVAVIFFGSLQLISVGLLGEYIGRVYLETKRRPTYLIRREYGAQQASRAQGN
ncbi:MAG: glycosyltransferase family 2 protein [Burkholderiaceae bacterium]